MFKKSILFATFVALLIFSCFIWLYYHDEQDCVVLSTRGHVISTTRPEDFPEVLIVPEKALNVKYTSILNPETKIKRCQVTFGIEEPYPAENIRTFIEEHLQSLGWSRLKYKISPSGHHRSFEPRWTTRKIEGVTQEIDRWQDEWVNDKYGHITIIILHGFAEEVGKQFGNLSVTQIFAPRDKCPNQSTLSKELLP